MAPVKESEHLDEERWGLAKLFLKVQDSVRLMFKHANEEKLKARHLLLGNSGALLKNIERLREMIPIHQVSARLFSIARPDFLKKPLEPRCFQFGECKMNGKKGCPRPSCIQQAVNRFVDIW